MEKILRCPNCGAALEYSADRQMLACRQCGTQMTVDAYRHYEQTQTGETQPEASRTESQKTEQADTDSRQRGTMDMKIYHCSSCGAVLETDPDTVATRCAYCGNPTLISDRIEGRYRPDLIIPFAISKEKAMESYEQWTGKGPLTPRELKARTVTERMTGIYVPFWLYDYHAEGRVTANTTRTRVIPRPDGEDIYTDYFLAVRELSADFRGIPADAARNMDDTRMDRLEPFNMQGVKEFAPEYLSGYLAQRYDQTGEEVSSRAQERAKSYILSMAMGTIAGYSSVVPLDSRVNLSLLSRRYALFPVWMMNCTYRGKPFSFVMNGQTGRIVADRPVSAGRAAGTGAVVFAGAFAALMLGGMLL
jgi:DNA-directed RNA polymerase subunit RPC12/RpoP